MDITVFIIENPLLYRCVVRRILIIILGNSIKNVSVRIVDGIEIFYINLLCNLVSGISVRLLVHIIFKA